MKLPNITKELLFEEIYSYINEEESLKRIKKAYNYAQDKHKDQYRKSGEPYFVHILNVAYELAKLKTDPETIMAGLLHDTIEDCDVDIDEFKELFSEEVLNLVKSVTKISTIQFKDEKEYQAENHRKILIAMAQDIRVIIIKLADRLHNMRTLEFQSEEKQKKIAKETIDVYAPIAHRLGLAEIKNELEDLCFFYLDNEKYREIAKQVASKKRERDQQIKDMLSNISNILSSHNLKFDIFGRSKHLYSIHKKMLKKNKRFDEILDLLAIRIITETELNCYEILGYIHSNFRPIPGRLKDYIAMPKYNMYQSLHTSVVGSEGKIYEIQIRTYKMDEVAEKGVAAHWSYKETKTSTKTVQKEIVKELEWLKAFEESDNKQANEYMDEVKEDIFNSNIYVLTPKGRVIDLPYDSIPIDFAYKIHTEIGHQTIGAIVNGALVPLNTALKTGDVVELRTNKSSTPSEDWLKIVKTNGARNKIKNYFAKLEAENKEIKIEEGKRLFISALNNRKLDIKEYTNEKKLDNVINGFRVSTIEDMYYAIGMKSLSCQAIIEKMVKLAKKELDVNEINQHGKRNVKSNKSGVKIAGIDSLMVSIASCCSPVFGDEIIGYVTKGQGIKVHRMDCPNVKNNKRNVNVQWEESDEGLNYDVNILVSANDRNYLLTDLITVISQYKANISSVNVASNKEDLTACAHLTISVKSKTQLENIITNLKKVNSVFEVTREIK